MFLTYLLFVVAISLSAIGAFYSIAGLTAIFAAAVIPIMVMGGILEIAKVSVTVWLHEYWGKVKWTMKAYLVSAVALLMLITSMGIFGFLSKAHLDQTVPAGDVAAELQIFDEKIQTQRDNISSARQALQQMDAQVDQMLSRTTNDRGAERAVQIRRQQAKERARLQEEIAQSQKIIVNLQAERSPKAAEVRKIEAEVGPIKYIAALIYGDNPDANILEKAVRWVIIILVIVFDPLAIVMLLAATESREWEKQKKQSSQEQAEPLLSPGEPLDTVDTQENLPDPVVEPPPEITDAVPDTTIKSTPVQPDTPLIQIIEVQEEDDEDDEDDDEVVKYAKMLWKKENPDLTLKEQRRLYLTGQIDHLPWLDYIEKSRQELRTGFGNILPDSAQRGDTFVLTSTMPTTLHKFNGKKWIEIDKTTSDNFVFNADYVDWLIQRISDGQYDPEFLSTNEREQIESKLRREV